MPYCPNCSSEVEAAAAGCKRCGAEFGPEGWKPTEIPLPQPPKGPGPGVILLKALFILPLAVVGAGLIVLGWLFRDALGAIVAGAGLACIGAVVGLVIARRKAALIAAFVAGALVLGSIWAAVAYVVA